MLVQHYITKNKKNILILTWKRQNYRKGKQISGSQRLGGEADCEGASEGNEEMMELLSMELWWRTHTLHVSKPIKSVAE
jgi:hypothetical protein